MNYIFSFSVDFHNGIDISQLQHEIGQQVFSATCTGASQLEDDVIIYFDQALSDTDVKLLSQINSLHFPENFNDYVLSVDGTINISSSNGGINAISVFNQNDSGGMRISAGVSGCVFESLGVLDIMSNGLEMNSPSVSISSNIFYNRSKTLHVTKTPANVNSNDNILTIEQITNGIIVTASSSTLNSVSFPSASVLVPALCSVFLDILPNDSWEFSFINTSSMSWTLTASSGVSIIGSGLVAGNNSAKFKVRITNRDSPAYSVYRLS